MRSIRIIFMLLVCSIVCSANASVSTSENGVQTTLASNPKKPAPKKKPTSKKPAKKKTQTHSRVYYCYCPKCTNKVRKAGEICDDCYRGSCENSPSSCGKCGLFNE